MKKTYPVSNNARHVCSWRKHLRPEEKRRVNKSTRKIGRAECDTFRSVECPVEIKQYGND
jgi:hypothetical protein